MMAVRKGDLLFRARTGSLEVNGRTYRWNQEVTNNCFMCKRGEEETTQHCMVECRAYPINAGWQL